VATAAQQPHAGDVGQQLHGICRARCSPLRLMRSVLGLNWQDLASLNFFECFQRRRDQRRQIFNRIACRSENNDADRAIGQVLLKPKTAVSGEQYRKAGCLGGREQVAILQARPRLLLDCSDMVPDQKRR
jgi:hypothetical protein